MEWSDREGQDVGNEVSDAPLGRILSISKRSASLMASQNGVESGRSTPDWLNYFQRCSRLLVAVIDPNTLAVQYANDYFCNLAGGLATRENGVSSSGLEQVLQLLTDADNLAIQRLYGRHLIHLIFRDIYGLDLQNCRLLDEALFLKLQSPLFPMERRIEFWLRSEQLRVKRCQPEIDEFADLDLSAQTSNQLRSLLVHAETLQQLETRLQWDNYDVEGYLLLEGVDVTVPETIHRVTQLLIDQDTILNPDKFVQVDQELRSLFQAQSTVIATLEADQLRSFMGTAGAKLDTATYPLEIFQQSHVMQALESRQVMVIPDLASNVQTDWGRSLLRLGVRSVLLIPLLSSARPISETEVPVNPQPLGVVAILSDRPYGFDGLDCCHAEQLIPAFTVAIAAAQRHLVQRRFIAHIHPSVEWRFLEEAERRSLGLPAQPIVFEKVYPLYGISDIRGSSEERNRAIQSDLLQQCHLALAVMEAVCAAHPSSLAEQQRLDLLEHIQQLQDSITVDAEVTEIRYLRQQVEQYFDYFAGCGEAVQLAIAAYQQAWDPEQECVYRARAHYDQTIGQINALLRETWEYWQTQMQKISPHYCDIETTDGIDHMIYAGQSIDLHFGEFQLRSLRYEQLRAVCDCARTAFQLQEKCGTPLQMTHLVLVQDSTVDIFHDESTERLFDVRGTRDTRYEIVKKRIDKALDAQTQARITQPGALTIVYSTEEEWSEYQHYLRYLNREGWVDGQIERGTVQPLQGVTGLKFARVRVLPVVESPLC